MNTNPVDASPLAALKEHEPILVQDVPKEPGKVLMEEEVFATWVATALIVSVLGSQFSSRTNVKSSTSVPLDIVTMLLALFVLVWASLCHFNVIPVKNRSAILVAIIAYMIAYFVYVMILVGLEKL